MNELCNWYFQDDMWFTGCHHVLYDVMVNGEWQYCPYCGKRINII